MSSLATVRDALLLAHYQKIIDDVEFAVLYDANLSKPVFPYSKFDRFSLDNWERFRMLDRVEVWERRS